MIAKYDIRARIAPGLLLCIPALLTVGAIGLEYFDWIKTILGGAVISIVLGYGLSMLLRSGGVALQDRLYRKWGGPPSTRFLRWSDESLSNQKKALIHSKISKDFNINLLSPDEEKARAKEADRIISDGFDSLREKIRSTKKTGKLWEIHNMEYGFYRNLLGSWYYGLLLSILGIIILTVIYFLKTESDIKLLVGVGLNILYGTILTTYSLTRGEASLKHAAEQYVTSAVEAYLHSKKI